MDQGDKLSPSEQYQSPSTSFGQLTLLSPIISDGPASSHQLPTSRNPLRVSTIREHTVSPSPSSNHRITHGGRPLPSGPRALRTLSNPTVYPSPSRHSPGTPQFIPRGPSADRERLEWERAWRGGPGSGEWRTLDEMIYCFRRVLLLCVTYLIIIPFLLGSMRTLSY
jgi:hypothetical protein